MTPNKTLALAKPKPKINWFEFCLVLLGWIGIQIEKKKMSMVEPNLEGFLNQKKQVKNHYFPLLLTTHFSLYKNFLSRSFAVNLFACFSWILCISWKLMALWHWISCWASKWVLHELQVKYAHMLVLSWFDTPHRNLGHVVRSYAIWSIFRNWINFFYSALLLLSFPLF